MANINETPVWPEGIYQIEEIDRVQGGPGGTANVQASQLANRTAYLKKRADALAAPGGVALVGQGVMAVNTIADLLALPAGQRKADMRYLVKEYHAGTGVGGGEFYWDAASAEPDNGGTAFTVSGVTTGRWLRRFDGALHVTWFGAIGDGVTDNLPAIQSAVDFALQNGKSLYAPAGVYILDTSQGPIYLSRLTSPLQSLHFFGAGRGLTIFKEKDGSTLSFGRFCKMFYFYHGSSTEEGLPVGSFTFLDMTFDKNGRSNGTPPTPYQWEQAHIFSWAGTSPRSFDAITFERCEFKDKIGACLNFSSADVSIRSLIIRDVQSTWHPNVSQIGNGVFGQRGCLEFGVGAEAIVIDSVNASYSQIEPVLESNKNRRRHSRFINSKIDTIEYTDKGGYSKVDVVNVDCMNKLLFRGVEANVINSTFRAPDIFAEGVIRIRNSTILLKYDPIAIQVFPFTFGAVINRTGYTLVDIAHSRFLIDSDEVDENASGYAIKGNGSSPPGSRKVILRDVEFDSRLYGSVDVYGTSDLNMSGCVLAGSPSGRALQLGGFGTAGGRYVVDSNDFSDVKGSWVHFIRSNSVWSLEMRGVYSLPDQVVFSTNGTAIPTDMIKVLPVFRSSLPPNSGYFVQGQRVENSAPVQGGVEGWICTESGIPGVWKAYGNIKE